MNAVGCFSMAQKTFSDLPISYPWATATSALVIQISFWQFSTAISGAMM
jgi:hypothetical protein